MEALGASGPERSEGASERRRALRWSPVNDLVLQPGTPLRQRLLAASRGWMEADRDARRLLTGTAFFLAQCWLNSSGAWRPGSPGFDRTIFDYLAASREALGGDAAWHALLAQKEFCSRCGLRYSLENLAICADCLQYVCPSCTPAHQSSCPGELVG